MSFQPSADSFGIRNTVFWGSDVVGGIRGK